MCVTVAEMLLTLQFNAHVLIKHPLAFAHIYKSRAKLGATVMAPVLLPVYNSVLHSSKQQIIWAHHQGLLCGIGLGR